MQQAYPEPATERNLTEEQLLIKVRQHENGIDPAELVGGFVSQGYSRRSVQRAVHRALDKRKVDFDQAMCLRALAASAP